MTERYSNDGLYFKDGDQILEEKEVVDIMNYSVDLEAKLDFKEKEYRSLEKKYSDEYDKYREELKRGLDWKEKCEIAIEVLMMVEDNRLMPHKHEDPRERLYCLAERARLAIEFCKQ